MKKVTPGRGCDEELGPMVNVYPAGSSHENARHGLWRGLQAEQVVWEVRYTRGRPTGPYRQWDAAGNLIATWPYNWEGEIAGWARWFDAQGNTVFKYEISAQVQPAFDAIGAAQQLQEWAIAIQEIPEILGEQKRKE